MTKPILYTLQNCPYAMRARMALLISKTEVTIRNIVTKNKPRELFSFSPKGTVPILILSNGNVVEESLEIMLWALKRNDPQNILYASNPDFLADMIVLIDTCDTDFRKSLSAYKNSRRYHLDTKEELRDECEIFISKLESKLSKNKYLYGAKLGLADIALLPFIRQFTKVERSWFREAGYPLVFKWLSLQMDSLLFSKTMKKYPLWTEDKKELLLNWD